MPFAKPFAAALLLAASLPAAAQSRQETLLNTNWKFTKGEQPNGAKPELNDAKWQTVRIPHDWAITETTSKPLRLNRITSRQPLLNRAARAGCPSWG